MRGPWQAALLSRVFPPQSEYILPVGLFGDLLPLCGVRVYWKEDTEWYTFKFAVGVLEQRTRITDLGSESSCTAWPLSRKLRWMLEKLTPLLPWGLIEGLPWVWRLLSFGVSYEDTLATTSVCELPVAAVPSHLGGGTCRQVPGKMALSSLQMSAPGCPTKCLLHHTPATWSPRKRRSLSGFPP